MNDPRRNDEPLERVRRAAESKRRAQEEYRAALAAAHEGGFSFAEIARTLHVTRQAIRQALSVTAPADKFGSREKKSPDDAQTSRGSGKSEMRSEMRTHLSVTHNELAR
jgi:predicted DNA-binding protein YlxM (UPF0122 family)